MAIRCQAVCGCVVGIKLYCAPEQAQRFATILEGKRIMQRESTQEQIVRIDTFRRLAVCALDLCMTQPRFNGADDARGNAVLEFEDIAQCAVVAVGPEM